MRVARVGGFEQQASRLGLEQRRQHGGQRYVMRVRAFVVAPADMHAHAVGGDVAKRVVQDFNMDLGAANELGFAAFRIHHVAAQAEVGGVDLQDQASGDDGLVFVAHPFRHILHVAVQIAVEGAGLEQRDDTGRGAVHEAMRVTGSIHCRPHHRQVQPHRRHVLHRDGTGAAGAAVAGRAAGLRQPFQKARKVSQIGRRAARAVALKPCQAVLDVGGVGDLRRFAIGGDVDARVALAAQHVDCLGPHHRIIGRLVQLLAAFAGEEQVGDALAAREGTDMGGEDARHLRRSAWAGNAPPPGPRRRAPRRRRNHGAR